MAFVTSGGTELITMKFLSSLEACITEVSGDTVRVLDYSNALDSSSSAVMQRVC